MKKSVLSLGVVLICSLSLLGCSSESERKNSSFDQPQQDITTNSKSADDVMNELMGGNKDNSVKLKSPQGFLRIGQKASVAYVQHLKGKDYQLGLEMENGELEWLPMDDGKVEKVIVSPEITEAYFERVADQKVNGLWGGDEYLEARYIIYIPKNYPITGGMVEIGRTGGKNNRAIYGQSLMIYPSRSS